MSLRNAKSLQFPAPFQLTRQHFNDQHGNTLQEKPMAITTCQNCGHKISSKAQKCPKCNNAVNVPTRLWTGNNDCKEALQYAIGGVITVVFAWNYFGQMSSSPTSAEWEEAWQAAEAHRSACQSRELGRHDKAALGCPQ